MEKINWSDLNLENIGKILSPELLLSFFGRVGLAVFAVVFGMFIVRWVDKFAQQLMGKLIDYNMIDASPQDRMRATVRRQTLSGIAHHGLVLVGYLIITLMTLDILGLDIRPILATAGVASLAIGFGAQNLVKDVISGFFIILEDQYGQGDYVNLDGDSGFVEQLNLRTTQLRNGEGVLIVKTNGSINVVRNMTKDWSQLDFKIGVAYHSDMPKVMKILSEEGKKLKSDYNSVVLEEPAVLGIEEFGASEIIVRMQIKMLPGNQWQLKRELNMRIKNRFDLENIEIPFPQRTVWTKSV